MSFNLLRPAVAWQRHISSVVYAPFEWANISHSSCNDDVTISCSCRSHGDLRGPYRGAAGQGDPDGQYDLATLYAAGRGVPLDYESAWYGRAASSGHARSASQLKSLSKTMTARQLERTQAKLAAQEKPVEQSDKSQASGLLRLSEDK